MNPGKCVRLDSGTTLTPPAGRDHQTSWNQFRKSNYSPKSTFADLSYWQNHWHRCFGYDSQTNHWNGRVITGLVVEIPGNSGATHSKVISEAMSCSPSCLIDVMRFLGNPRHLIRSPGPLMSWPVSFFVHNSDNVVWPFDLLMPRAHSRISNHRIIRWYNEVDIASFTEKASHCFGRRKAINHSPWPGWKLFRIYELKWALIHWIRIKSLEDHN